MKLTTSIHHVSGHCCKGFQGQRSKVKVITGQLTHYCGGIHFDVWRSGSSVLFIAVVVVARGRPRRAWTDYLKDWIELRNYSELKRTAEDRTIWNALACQPSA